MVRSTPVVEGSSGTKLDVVDLWSDVPPSRSHLVVQSLWLRLTFSSYVSSKVEASSGQEWYYYQGSLTFGQPLVQPDLQSDVSSQ